MSNPSPYLYWVYIITPRPAYHWTGDRPLLSPVVAWLAGPGERPIWRARRTSTRYSVDAKAWTMFMHNLWHFHAEHLADLEDRVGATRHE